MRQCKKKGFSFWKCYVIYVALLAVLVIAAVGYVKGKLQEYEKELPEQRVEEALAEMKQSASNGDFWTQYQMKEISAGKFEKHLDIQDKYLKLFADDSVTYSRKNGIYDENTLVFVDGLIILYFAKVVKYFFVFLTTFGNLYR